MGGLILCRERSVRHPYYVAELGLHLYTGEELSYYIFNHLLLVPDNFLNEKLYDFLTDLDGAGLADRLRKASPGRSLYESLTGLLQELHYYGSSAEIAAFRRRVAELERMTPPQRQKARADYLFGLDRYERALKGYRALLAQDKPETPLPAELKGNVWYNMACCHSRMENFEAALPCLQKAYELLQDAAFPEKLFALTLFDPALRLPKELALELTREQRKQYQSNFEERGSLAAYQGKALEAAVLQDKPEKERGDAYLALLQSWKREYRRNQV